jgi:hypothetical protein
VFEKFSKSTAIQGRSTEEITQPVIMIAKAIESIERGLEMRLDRLNFTSIGMKILE